MGGMIVPSWFCYSPTPLSLSNCAMIHLYTECRWDHLFSWRCLHWYSLDSLNTSWNLADWIMRKLLDQWSEMRKPERSFYHFWVSLFRRGQSDNKFPHLPYESSIGDLVCFGIDQPSHRLYFYFQDVTGFTDEKRSPINIDYPRKRLGSEREVPHLRNKLVKSLHWKYSFLDIKVNIQSKGTK